MGRNFMWRVGLLLLDAYKASLFHEKAGPLLQKVTDFWVSVNEEMLRSNN